MYPVVDYFIQCGVSLLTTLVETHIISLSKQDILILGICDSNFNT